MSGGKKQYYSIVFFCFFVVLLLISVYYFPFKSFLSIVPQDFSFSFSDLLKLYTTNFVHNRLNHLGGNIIFFMFSFFFLAYFASRTEEMKLFKITTFLSFIIFPFLVFSISLIFFWNSHRDLLGFSGIVSALIGALPYFTMKYLKNKLIPELNIYSAILLYPVILGLVLKTIYGFLIGVFFVVPLFYYFYKGLKGDIEIKNLTAIIPCLFSIGVFLIWVSIAVFPENLGYNGRTNVPGHLAGLSTMLLVPLIARKPRFKKCQK